MGSIILTSLKSETIPVRNFGDLGSDPCHPKPSLTKPPFPISVFALIVRMFRIFRVFCSAAFLLFFGFPVFLQQIQA